MTSTVLITAVGGGAVGRQIVKALRCSDLPLRLIVTDASPFAFGLTEADKAVVAPRADDPGYIDFLLNLCLREKVQFLVPGFEAEMETVSANRARFEEAGVRLLLNDHRVIDLCQDKWRTYQFLRENGFPTAKTWLVETAADLEKVAAFPAIVKPARRHGGSKYVNVARDRKELEAYAGLLLRDGFVGLVQEYVGTPEEEYTVGVLSTPKGERIASIAMRRVILDSISTKLRIPSLNGDDSLVVSSGFSQGLFDDFPDVREVCEKISARVGSRGPLNVQCRKTDQGVVAFEINPRLSGTAYLRALVGFNEAEILIRYHLTGSFPAAVPYKKGYVFREFREKFVSAEEIAAVSGVREERS